MGRPVREERRSRRYDGQPRERDPPTVDPVARSLRSCCWTSGSGVHTKVDAESALARSGHREE